MCRLCSRASPKMRDAIQGMLSMSRGSRLLPGTSLIRTQSNSNALQLVRRRSSSFPAVDDIDKKLMSCYNDNEFGASLSRHTYTHSVLTAIFPGEPGLAGCPLNSLCLHLFLDCASFWDRPKLSMSFLTQSHQVFFGRPLCLIPLTYHVVSVMTQQFLIWPFAKVTVTRWIYAVTENQPYTSNLVFRWSTKTHIDMHNDLPN